MGVIDYS